MAEKAVRCPFVCDKSARGIPKERLYRADRKAAAK